MIFDDGSEPRPLKTRSLVGLLPLCATTVLKQKSLDMLPDFKHRVDWFLAKRPELVRFLRVKRFEGAKNPGRCLLAILVCLSIPAVLAPAAAREVVGVGLHDGARHQLPVPTDAQVAVGTLHQAHHGLAARQPR